MSTHVHRWLGPRQMVDREHWPDRVLCWKATGLTPAHDYTTADQGALTVSPKSEDVDCPECIAWMHA